MLYIYSYIQTTSFFFGQIFITASPRSGDLTTNPNV